MLDLGGPAISDPLISTTIQSSRISIAGHTDITYILSRLVARASLKYMSFLSEQLDDAPKVQSARLQHNERRANLQLWCSELHMATRGGREHAQDIRRLCLQGLCENRDNLRKFREKIVGMYR